MSRPRDFARARASLRLEQRYGRERGREMQSLVCIAAFVVSALPVHSDDDFVRVYLMHVSFLAGAADENSIAWSQQR